MRYCFSGHESFPCKSMWLKKGYDYLVDRNRFTDPDAVVKLGVGKNMVQSIRFWLRAFGLLNDDEATEIAHYLFDDRDGRDPYAEDNATLWILHYMLVVTAVSSIYRLFFVDLQREKKEFDKEQVLSFIKRKCNVPEQKNVFNENTVKKDIRVLLQNYLAPTSPKGYEEYASILLELGLLRENEGKYSFLIIGTYGTGKSSFLMALEQDLLNNKSKLVSERSVFADAKSFEFMNIVGDYSSLSTLLSKELSIAPSDDSKNVFSTLTRYLIKLKDQNKFLFIFIDEFGKILEHAANNNPEKELYFLQTLAEFVNVSSRNVILITTLHQNFGSYAHKLTETQRNEWLKVKGRFKELVFAEPVEQLLFLAAESLTKSKTMTDNAKENFLEIFSLAKKNKIISESLTVRTSKMLYPLDAVAASCLTLAIQRYGQNERTLFSFLHDTVSNSINSFLPNDTTTYNLAVVYDYVIYNFYTALAETNLDSTNWRAIRVAIERVESGIINKNNIDDALKIVKSIGLLNLFYNGVVVDLAFLETYALKALGIKNPRGIIEKLTANKIIRFAAYKSQFILFEGTDINIEDELYKAATIVPVPKLVAAEIAPYVKKTVVVASASYYRTGTPRYFQYVVSNEPYDVEPTGDDDGFINLIFPLEDIKDCILKLSASSGKAIVYAYFNDTEKIVRHLYEIKKLQYLLDNVVLEDRIAKGEILKQQSFEAQLLNEAINSCVEMPNGQVEWFFNGEQQIIKSRKDFNKLLSTVCDVVYNETPIIRNELSRK